MRASSLARVGWTVTISLVAGALILGLANPPEAPLYETTSTIINPTFTAIVGLAARRIVRDLDPDSPRQRASGRSAAAEWEHSELG
jgi:hypothetical protein